MNGGGGYIATEISQRKGGRGKQKKGKKKKEERLLGDERSWELTSSDEKSFLPGTSNPVFLAPIGSLRLLPNQLSSHQSPTFGPTLYKFIVTGLLGLNYVRRWAGPKKRDPTHGIPCG